MKNPFIYSIDNKRYHTLNYHFLKTFGKKLYKASVDARFSCPNIDGTVSHGGCSFCLGGSGFFCKKALSVTEQLTSESCRIEKKHGINAPVIAYFQAHTNTYAPLKVLKEKYEEALSFKNVCGISIATRADCLEDDKIEYLSSLSRKTYLTVELGLQTANDKTAKQFNRGYDFGVFENALKKLQSCGIRTCVHIINGLCGEDENDMLNTAKTLGALMPNAVKISLLYVLKNTGYESLYQKKLYNPLSFDEYIDITCRQLTYLPPNCVIERITGDGIADSLIAPLWSKNKIAVLGGIDKHMAELDIYQGCKIN